MGSDGNFGYTPFRQCQLKALNIWGKNEAVEKGWMDGICLIRLGKTFLWDKLIEECFSFLVAVMVLGSVSPPILVLLLVLPVVFLVFRRRKQAKMPEDLIQFQSMCPWSDHYIKRKYFKLLINDILMLVLQWFRTLTALMVWKRSIISALIRMAQRWRGMKHKIWRVECEEDRDREHSKNNDQVANF